MPISVYSDDTESISSMLKNIYIYIYKIYIYNQKDRQYALLVITNLPVA